MRTGRTIKSALLAVVLTMTAMSTTAQTNEELVDAFVPAELEQTTADLQMDGLNPPMRKVYMSVGNSFPGVQDGIIAVYSITHRTIVRLLDASSQTLKGECEVDSGVAPEIELAAFQNGATPVILVWHLSHKMHRFASIISWDGSTLEDVTPADTDTTLVNVIDVDGDDNCELLTRPNGPEPPSMGTLYARNIYTYSDGKFMFREAVPYVNVFETPQATTTHKFLVPSPSLHYSVTIVNGPALSDASQGWRETTAVTDGSVSLYHAGSSINGPGLLADSGALASASPIVFRDLLTLTTYNDLEVSSTAPTDSVLAVLVRPMEPDVEAPFVSIVEPAVDARLNGTITARATASDDRGVVDVTLSVSGGSSVVVAAAPYDWSFSSSGLSSGSHTFSAVAKDLAGNQAEATVEFVVDRPPTAPPTLSVDGIGRGFVTLGWGQSSDDLSTPDYSVMRSEDGGTTFTEVARTALQTYTDTSVVKGTTYQYEVKAVDSAGFASPSSPRVEVRAR